MRGLTTPLAALAAAASLASADQGVTTTSNVTDTCYDGLFMIVARGTGEAPDTTGVTGIVADQVAADLDGVKSKVVALDYPAVFNPYIESEFSGAKAMREAVVSYHDSCPDGKIALFGYSQGAQVASDAVCGGSEPNFKNVTALPEDIIENNVVAIILFGDPSHVANTTYDRGTSIEDGIFTRRNITLCEDYDDIIVSYCDTGDIYCDEGDNTTVHGQYVQRYGDKAAEFVVDAFKNATSSGSGSGSGGNSTASTGTATATTATGSSTMSASTMTGTGSGSMPTSAMQSSATGSASPSPTGAAGVNGVPVAGTFLGASLLGLVLSLL